MLQAAFNIPLDGQLQRVGEVDGFAAQTHRDVAVRIVPLRTLVEEQGVAGVRGGAGAGPMLRPLLLQQPDLHLLDRLFVLQNRLERLNQQRLSLDGGFVPVPAVTLLLPVHSELFGVDGPPLHFQHQLLRQFAVAGGVALPQRQCRHRLQVDVVQFVSMFHKFALIKLVGLGVGRFHFQEEAAGVQVVQSAGVNPLLFELFWILFLHLLVFTLDIIVDKRHGFFQRVFFQEVVARFADAFVHQTAAADEQVLSDVTVAPFVGSAGEPVPAAVGILVAFQFLHHRFPLFGDALFVKQASNILDLVVFVHRIGHPRRFRQQNLFQISVLH